MSSPLSDQTLTSPPYEPISLSGTASNIAQPWSPVHLTTLNATTSFKLAKLSGSFVWPSHPATDELFYVVSGGPLELQVATDEESRHEKDGWGVVKIREGEMWVVPKGWRHRPVAPVNEKSEETVVMLVELVGTVNTGDEADGEGKGRTVIVDEGLNR